MITVKDLKTLRKLTTNNKEGELAIVEETHVLYRWDGANWITHKPKGGLQMTLYQINQQAMTGLPALSQKTIQEKKKLFFDYCNSSEHKDSQYFCLLNREQYDFTVFDIGFGDPKPKVENEVIELLQNRGVIKDINITKDNTIECWVTKDNETSLVYYFFDYNGGVIQCQ